MYSSQVSASDFHPQTLTFFKGKRVAVPGGSGFIGSHVVEQLLAIEATPVVISRHAQPAFLRGVANRIEVRVCDLADESQVLKALQQIDVVLHLAASVAGIEYNAKHPATIFSDNMRVFMNTIGAATRVGVERFLVTSSACVYPRHCSLPTPESEGMKDEPEPTNSGYGWAKRMEEYLGIQYAKEFGLSVAIGRPYNAYGPRDNFEPGKSHVIPSLILKAFQSQDGTFKVWGDGSHSRSFLYVDDFARGLIEVAARHPHAEPLNIGADEEVTIREVAELIAEYVGTCVGRKLTPVFDASGLTGQPRRRCDTTRIANVLQYRAAVGFRDGLKRTVQWFHENR